MLAFFVILSIFSFLGTECGFVPINQEFRPITGIQISPQFMKFVGMFSVADSPLPKSLRPDGYAGGATEQSSVFSYVRLDFTEIAMNVNSRAPDPTNPAFEIVLAHHDFRASIGFPGFREGYCCNLDYVAQGKCTVAQLNKLFINDYENIVKKSPTLFRYLPFYPGNLTPATGGATNYSGGWLIETTGMWYLFIANCNQGNATTSATIKIAGEIEFRNPYGYLPGQLVAYLPIFWLIATVYFILGITYLVLTIKHRKGLMALQHALFAIIIIGLIEALILSGGFTAYNFYGSTYMYGSGGAAVFKAIKMTGLFIVLLLIGMGLSITRQKLDMIEITWLVLLSLTYFGFKTTWEFSEAEKEAGGSLPVFFEIASTLGIYITAPIFCCWILFATYTTMMELKITEQSFKYNQYKKLIVLIFIACIISLLIAVIQTTIRLLRVQDDYFRWWWIWELYWQCVIVVTVVSVSLLWRPTERNELYAHSMQLPQSDDQIEMSEPKEGVDLDGDDDNDLSSTKTQEKLETAINGDNEEKKVDLDNLSSSDDSL